MTKANKIELGNKLFSKNSLVKNEDISSINKSW